MAAALAAGGMYAAIVFAVGFVLGAVRVLVLMPRLGEIGALVIELPIMLAVSWFVCGWLLGRFSVRAAWRYRLVMGGSAFILLVIAELGVSILAFGRSMAEHFGTYRSWAAAFGLAAQVVFAAFPLIRKRGTRRLAATPFRH